MTYIPEAKISDKDVPSDLYAELFRCEGFNPLGQRPTWAHTSGGLIGTIEYDRRVHRLRRLSDLGLATSDGSLTDEGRAFVAFLRDEEEDCLCEPHAEPPTSGWNPKCPRHGRKAVAR